MRNGNENRLSLDTIPEEGNDLPRISGLIPKSPETRKREQEYLQQFESHKEHIKDFISMLIMQRNIKQICLNDHYSMGNHVDYRKVNRSRPTSSPTMSTWPSHLGA